MNFVAIDFETANSKREPSACAVGLVVVRGGQVLSEEKPFDELIRPPPHVKFHWANIEVHKITPEKVANSPTFGELWPALECRINGRILVGHGSRNSRRDLCDIRFLRDCVDYYKLELPPLRYVNTCRMAWELLPGRAHYDLEALAGYFQIELVKPPECRNKALEDAKATAHLALILAGMSPEGLDPFVQDVSERTETDRAVRSPDRNRRDRKSVWSAGTDPVAPRMGAAPQTLVGKTVVITGTLASMSRGPAEDAVAAAGGRAVSSVSRKTSFVVVGAEPGSKADKARELGVETVDEKEFLNRLGYPQQ